MPCTPYNPAVGLFINTLGWGTGSSGQWSFGLETGSNDVYQLKKAGTVVDAIQIPNPTAVRWIFFPTGNFLAVRNATTSGGFDDYRIWIFDLRNATVTHYAVGNGPWTLSSGAQLHFHPSQDGMAFFMFAGESTPNSTKQHVVFRTDTGAPICSWGSIFNVLAQRLAEVTAGRTVRIMTSPGSGGPTIWAEAALPSGNCDVQPNSQTFPQAVVGGPQSLAITTRQFTLKNTGNDCMTVISIANAAPFSVSATSKTLPAALNAGESMTVTVEFAPPAIGNYGPTDLALACSPAAGEDKLRCSGSARAPIKKLTLIPPSLAFGKLPVGSTDSKILKLRNDGEVPLAVSIAASPAGIAFSWSVFNSTIGLGNSQDISVSFAPNAEGPVSATLIVNDATSAATHNVPLSGSGCVANAEIHVPPAPFPLFGDVQRGFRMVRYITVRNAGDGTLSFTARIDGADKALYGLVQSPPNESIINVVNSRGYSVAPISPCGAGLAGGGDTLVTVVFFANDAPRVTSAELIIEGHNATNAVPASFTYSLSATITPPVAVDAALVLDRSGSMSQMIGARRKADAAAAGGRLFAELIRPDLEDRFAAVKYDEIIEVLQPIVDVTTANHAAIVAKINTTELAPRGTTCIAGGALVAKEQLSVPRAAQPATLTKAMVVLTDGKDNTGYHDPATGNWYSILGGNAMNPAGGMVATQPLPMPAGIRIYGIGLGKEEDIDKAALNRLSTATGAYSGVVGDLVGKEYFALEKYFAQIYMDVVGTSTITDPVFTIGAGEVQKHEFDVLQGDVGALIVVFDHEGMRLPFSIVSPKNEVIDGVSSPPGFAVRIGSTTTARFVEFRMPTGQPQRYSGRWSVQIDHPGKVCSGEIRGNKDMLPGFLPTKCRKHKDPVDYGIAIGIGSNFRMQPYVTPAPVRVGDPILLTAVITEAGLPVTDCTVSVKAVTPSGALWNFALFDDGAHEDGDRDDGEYAKLFTHTQEAGTYEFTFRAEGRSHDDEPVVREAVRTKYVEGRLVIDPNGGRPGEPDLCCERLTRLIEKALGGKRPILPKSATGKNSETPTATKLRSIKKPNK